MSVRMTRAGRGETGCIHCARWLAAGLCLTLQAGCEQKAEGPKRADNAAAHTARYHPDVVRSSPTGRRPAQAPERTPPPATQFADLLDAGVIGSPVLFVNNHTISVAEVLEPIIDDLQRQARILPERDYIEAVRTALREQIDYRISTILIYEEAKTRFEGKQIQELLDKRVDQMVDDLVNRRYGGVYARYEAHLKAVNYTPQQMKERLKREFIVAEFLRERFRPMLREPTRRELLAYYEARAEDFTTPERAELHLIEVPIASELERPREQSTAEEIEAAAARARARIARAREEIESGIDFATVARAYSRGAMASQGGAWGEITRGSLTRRWTKVGEALFTLQPGEMTVVETDESIFLVRCGKRIPAHKVPFEEAQKQLIDQAIEDQFTRLRGDYIRQLLSRATIRKRPEFTQALLAVVPRPQRPAEASTGSLFNPGG